MKTQNEAKKEKLKEGRRRIAELKIENVNTNTNERLFVGFCVSSRPQARPSTEKTDSRFIENDASY
jgi:hypothetical protein